MSTVYVTRAQVEAARISVKRNAARGRPSSPELIRIAEATVPATRTTDPAPPA